MRQMPKRAASPTTTATAPTAVSAPAPAAASSPGAGLASVDWPGKDLLDVPATARVLLSAWGGDGATIVPACPGAGKSRLVAHLAAALAHRADLRVAVAAQTREQAVELARRITALSDRCALIVSRKATHVPEGIRTVQGRAARWSAGGRGEVLVSTAARWLYVDPRQASADVLLVDEAWQCTYADLGALGALARQVVCVGDPGQVAPVVTGSTARWEGKATGPHVPGPAALLAAHGDVVPVYELANSWRLGPVTCALLSEHFYPQMPFGSRRPDEAVVTGVGQDLPEIVVSDVAVRFGPADPALLTALADRVRELLGMSYRERGVTRPLAPADVAVVVPHVSQAGGVRALLADVPGVLVGTVNALQGLERAAVVALHPLAGYRVPVGFGLDSGRNCVALSRHRGHVTVVVDSATESMLAAHGEVVGVVEAAAVLGALRAC